MQIGITIFAVVASTDVNNKKIIASDARLM
jgi:hypothetical protein